METDVLVVGAGPTGLSLACQLARHGVPFVVVERGRGVTPYSKAIGVHARTLEIYEQLGLAERAVERGTVAGRGRLLAGGRVRGEIDFSNIGEGMSPYPFILMLEQSKNEQLLYEYLLSRGEDVVWGGELESFSQSDEGVTARVKTPGGGPLTVRAKYLVGCDGAKSFVRRSLGLKFEGSTFERMFFVADARIDWAFSHDALHVCLAAESFVLFFPLKGERRYRVVGVFPEEFAKEEGDVLYEEIEGRIREEARLELDIRDVEWFSTYKVHTRHADSFSAGRCFLAGDAAHIHSPAGAQGMNTGIQDAYNLAWKLALVLKGAAGEKLLETYDEERRANAKTLLRTTDRLFQLAAGSRWPLPFLRMRVFPKVARRLLGLAAVKRFAFPRLSQIGINYRNGSLSRRAGGERFRVKAGDRMPYFLIDGRSVYDRLREPKFHQLVFSDEPENFRTSRAEFEGRHAGLADFHALPLRPQAARAFGADAPFAVLLRPDNYVAYVSTEISADEFGSYLDEFVGRPRGAGGGF